MPLKFEDLIAAQHISINIESRNLTNDFYYNLLNQKMNHETKSMEWKEEKKIEILSKDFTLHFGLVVFRICGIFFSLFSCFFFLSLVPERLLINLCAHVACTNEKGMKKKRSKIEMKKFGNVIQSMFIFYLMFCRFDFDFECTAKQQKVCHKRKTTKLTTIAKNSSSTKWWLWMMAYLSHSDASMFRLKTIIFI